MPDYFPNLIASMRFGEDIPRVEMRVLLARKRETRLLKGEYFLRAGEVPDRIGYVVSGLMRLFYVTEAGTEINKHFCVEGSLAVSYDAFLRREESSLFIQALEDTELIVIDRAAYDYLLSRHPCWQAVGNKLSELLVLLSHKREAELMLLDARER
jgi:CRP-like cAMP-binding protein